MADENVNKTKPAAAEEKKRWYVVRAIGGKEKKVRDSIELEIKRHKLENLVGQVLIPTEKVYQIKNGKKISKERSYLPGYVLLEAVLDGEVQHVINNVPNVIGFMSGTKGGEPMPMRVAEVNRILGKVDELSEHEEELNIPYVIGETVKVIDGPFNGFNGVIEEINEEKKKLQVMVKIFGRKTPLELSYMQVDKSN
ncbi:MAG: transcription termination/antitermination protein NusG [Crocinitomicaceae bacterium]|nr:transcription termination/antitermination protein NusG [Crocinitomicaceae bacterium]